MISLKRNKKPDLPVCEMMCDKPLHHKLDDYELTKFLNNHSTNLLIGKMGSGKTNLLYSFFKSKKLLNKVYDKIILFQPASSRASMKDQLFEQLPDAQKFEELTLENLESAEDLCDPDGNNCIIFDDMGAYLKDKEVLKKLKELIFNRRHRHISMFFLTQTYFSVHKEIRRLFSNIIVFKTSKTELANIFEEVVERPSEIVPMISKLVYDEPFNFLFINVNSGRMFKNWDEIEIDD
jgi:hypothetical protein